MAFLLFVTVLATGSLPPNLGQIKPALLEKFPTCCDDSCPVDICANRTEWRENQCWPLESLLTCSPPTPPPGHFWDLRGCVSGKFVVDTMTNDLIATPMDGPTCGVDGVSFDGLNDYMDLSDWGFGAPLSLEIRFFADGGEQQAGLVSFGRDISLSLFEGNHIGWSVHRSSVFAQYETNSWLTVVATASKTRLRLYKNGEFLGESSNCPGCLSYSTRLDHWLGRSFDDKYFDGQIASLKVWHRELDRATAERVSGAREIG